MNPHAAHARRVRAAFLARHGYEPRVSFAPGRINLIGAHVDYNGGSVLPVAIDRGTWVAAGRRDDAGAASLFRLTALDVDDELEWTPGRPAASAWARYVCGVVLIARARGLPLGGCDLVFGGDLPRGAGLSSSASLEVAIAFALDDLWDWGATLVELAELAWEAETRHVGVSCGILDQFAVALGRADHALHLDCRARSWSHVEFPEVELLVLDTKVERSLAASAYNERVRECRAALAQLGAHGGWRTVDPAVLESDEVSLGSLLRRRARHVVTEMERVSQAVDALRRHDVTTLGRLMRQSHSSCARDYEVSCDELDWLVEQVGRLPGVFGARMMGAGFGGVVVALCARGSVDEADLAVLAAGYGEAYGRAPGVHRVATGAGPRRVEFGAR